MTRQETTFTRTITNQRLQTKSRKKNTSIWPARLSVKDAFGRSQNAVPFLLF